MQIHNAVGLVVVVVAVVVIPYINRIRDQIHGACSRDSYSIVPASWHSHSRMRGSVTRPLVRAEIISSLVM